MEEKKKTCFVVGPIGSAGTETRNQADMLLAYIIRPALEPIGYEVKRADDEKSPGNISDHVINSVLDADLVVADLTGPNANAFYELGIRHREEKPTIHMIMRGQKPPFDVNNFNTIFYKLDNPTEHKTAAEVVQQHAKATEQEGFRVSNPITAARGHQQLAQSSDPMQQTVSTLMQEVTDLKRTVSTLAGVPEYGVEFSEEEIDLARKSRESAEFLKRFNDSYSTKTINGTGLEVLLSKMRHDEKD